VIENETEVAENAPDDVFECSPLRVDEEKETEEEVPNLSPKSDDIQTENEVSLAETETQEFSVLKDGEKVNSWMCKTCNCLFLNEVKIKTL